jgi:hypothetical protein
VDTYLVGHEPMITSEPMWTQRLIISEVDQTERDYF